MIEDSMVCLLLTESKRKINRFENIADAGGLSCIGSSKTESDLYRGIFVNWATIWRTKAKRIPTTLLQIDVHAPAKLRANATKTLTNSMKHLVSRNKTLCI